MICLIRDEKVSRLVGCEAIRAVQLSGRSRTAVTSVAAAVITPIAIASIRVDCLRCCVHPAHSLITRVRDKEVSCAVNSDTV